MTMTEWKWTNKFNYTTLLELAHDLDASSQNLRMEFAAFAKNYDTRFSTADKSFIEENCPAMLEVMKQKGYLEKAEPPEAVWSGLHLVRMPEGAVRLVDSKSDKILLEFHPDNSVCRVHYAAGGDGFFDTDERLIIE